MRSLIDLRWRVVAWSKSSLVRLSVRLWTLLGTKLVNTLMPPGRTSSDKRGTDCLIDMIRPKTDRGGAEAKSRGKEQGAKKGTLATRPWIWRPPSLPLCHVHLLLLTTHAYSPHPLSNSTRHCNLPRLAGMPCLQSSPGYPPIVVARMHCSTGIITSPVDLGKQCTEGNELFAAGSRVSSTKAILCTDS